MVNQGTPSDSHQKIPQSIIRIALEEQLLCLRLIDTAGEELQQMLELPGKGHLEQLDAADVIRRGCPENELKGALTQLLSSRKETIFLDETIIIFGGTSDPFFPFEGKFDSALRILEQLAAIHPKLICVQTRSPLVVLALPILRSLGKGAAVTIALEALSDSQGNRYTPQLPRPSERIKAARALKNLGIRTILQAAPLPAQREVLGYAELLDEISNQIYISDWFSLARKNMPLTKPNTKAKLESLLLKLAPQKLAHSPLEAWNARQSKLQAEDVGAEAA